MISLPPNHADTVGKIVFQVTDLEGKAIGQFEAKPEMIEAEGNFMKATANWPTDIAPRLVSTGMQIGY